MRSLLKFILIFLTLNLLHCPITNKFFLKPSRITGKEAKSIIQNRLAAFFVNDISTGSNDSLAIDFIIPNLTGIQDEKIYSRRDVESCATKIFLAAIAIDQPNIIKNRNKKTSDPFTVSDPNSRLYPPLICHLKEINKIIDLD